MASQSNIYVGVAGYVGRPEEKGAVGVFRRSAAGGEWQHVLKDLETHSVFVHPTDPNVVFAGTVDGVWRSSDRGATFQRANFPDQRKQIWCFLVDSRDSRRMYAGGSPVDVYRSDDMGQSWRRLPNPGVKDRATAPFAVRVMRMVQHPTRPDEIYAALEVNGVIRTTNGGETCCASRSCHTSGARSSATPSPRACWTDTRSPSARPIRTRWCSPAAWACSAQATRARAGRTWR
jgi:photosystem II stability/assembly factor-like uncharacterized protein